MTATRYAFDNSNPIAAEHHHLLAELLDPLTTARLAELGVGPGWHCLEVGAGGGSVARWLADRVAPTGSVLATDLQPQHIPVVPGLTVLAHDLTRDPLPDNQYDLVLARLVLRHLPARAAVLGRLVRALRPGGWLQVDEFDNGYEHGLLLPDNTRYPAFLAAKTAIMDRAGADGGWGRRAPAALADAGLVEVDVDVRLGVFRAGSANARLLAHLTHHLREQFHDIGWTDAELARVREILADPGFLATASPVYSVRGRRP